MEGKITLGVSTGEGEATLEKGDDGILVTFIEYLLRVIVKIVSRREERKQKKKWHY